jgi:asparagine synthase (glutamine-hydrolysing)
MSMQHSLEYRVPFLDEDLVQHAYSLPMRQKTNGQQGKLPLRQLHSQLYQGLHSNRPKTGFRLPLETWLGPDGMGELKSYLMDHQKATTYTENQLNNFFEQLTQKHPSISRDGVYHRLFMATALTLYPSAH